MSLGPAKPDILGDGWVQRSLSLDPAFDGLAAATLVHNPTHPRGERGAILYVHGYNDYFFHTELAESLVRQGWSFYALDLRRYGRSLAEHQHLSFCLDLTEYFEELRIALEVIRGEGHHRVVVNAHSTGGLVSSLFAADLRHRHLVDGLFLNAPFLAMRWLPTTSGVFRDLVFRAASRWPDGHPRFPSIPFYGWSLHQSTPDIPRARGEWTYNRDWKRVEGLPLRMGWVRAVVEGQTQVKRGLDLQIPVMVATSSSYGGGPIWNPTYARSDVVLEPQLIHQAAAGLGERVTTVRIEDALHDIWLSRPAVRQEAYGHLRRWLNSHFPE